MEAAKAHPETATVPTAAAKAYTESVTSFVTIVTTHMHPFDPAATTHEKFRNHF